MFYWLMKRILLGPWLRVAFRPWVEGLDHLPEEGPVILASNHLSFSDSVFLPLVVPRRVTFLAKSDYFTGKGVKGRATAAFFRAAGMVPVDRTGGRASEAAIKTGVGLLQDGAVLGIYPEGTRSPDGRLYRGRTGVARMAIESGALVLPVAMINTDKVQPIGKRIPRLGRVGIKIGPPLDFSRHAGAGSDRTVLRAVTDEVMQELARLSEQEYVDMYATKAKADLASS